MAKLPAPSTAVAAIAPVMDGGSGAEAVGAGGGIPPLDPQAGRVDNNANNRVRREGENWLKEDFGLMITGEIGETAEFRKTYQERAKAIAKRWRAFEDAGGKLTEEQNRFLRLFDEDGTGAALLDSVSGMATMDTVIDQEKLLQLLSWKKKVNLENVGNNPTKVDDKFPIAELQGLLNKHGDEIAPLIAGALGISVQVVLALAHPPGAVAGGIMAGMALIGAGVDKFIQSARRYGGLKISDTNTLDFSGLPDEYKRYIEWNSTLNEVEMHKFITGALTDQFKFYKALGVPITDLKAGTPWERMNIDAPGVVDPLDASQDVPTSWMRFRLDIFRQGGAMPDNPADKAKRWFEANRVTIGHYGSETLAIIRANKTESMGKSVQKMTETRDALTNQEKREELKKKKGKELETVKTDLTARQSDLKKVVDQIETKSIELAGLKKARSQIQGEKTRLTNNQKGLKGRQTKLTSSIQDTEDDYAIRITAAAPGDKKILATERDNKIRAIKAEIANIDTQLEQIRKEITPIVAQLTKISTLSGEIDDVLDPRRVELEGQIDELKKSQAKLTSFIESGIKPTDKKQATTLEAGIQALKRQSQTLSNLAQGRDGETELGMHDLIDRTNSEPEVDGRVYKAGYLKTLEWAFDVRRAPSGIKQKEFFAAATKLLSPDALAKVLKRRLNITDPPPPPPPVDLLDHVFGQIQTRSQAADRISRNMFNEAMYAVLEHVEKEGLKLT